MTNQKRYDIVASPGVRPSHESGRIASERLAGISGIRSGFDISESALRLAALSLYITAIELNGSPRPPKSLKFPEPLQGAVLHNNRRREERDHKSFVLGSLRLDISDDFNGRFDMVIGNPPWSRLRGDRDEVKALNDIFSELTRQVLIDRGLADIAKSYNNPDNDPDLPFLWKSIQWLKPGGIIAMTLPGRIFLKQFEKRKHL